jgi:diaminohydroxyphosphoribosylaminopyrimidine deaminase/5-amino-6-(5-phosphoribosylamino)uracil reductase
MNGFNEKMMRRAVQLARKGVGKTSPNPAVGCVIVKDGLIVGEGWHKKAGTPHAEIHALRQAGDLARGADLYVTLEPCSHFGKTPPCADAVVAAGIARVFIGMIDPNPLVSGQGVEKLRVAGVEVVAGLLETNCRELNLPFVKHLSTGLPYVTMKSAMTMDGKTAAASGDSRWITCDKSRKLVHTLRAGVDAVMTGSGTLLADDPELTVRMSRGESPIRIVVDSRLRTPVNCRLMNEARKTPVIIAAVRDDHSKIQALTEKGAEVILCSGKGGAVDLADLMKRLGARGIQSILLEGGERLCGEMLRNRLVDRFLLFYAPKLLGGEGKGLFAGSGAGVMNDSLPLSIKKVSRVGVDILVEAYPEVECLPV